MSSILSAAHILPTLRATELQETQRALRSPGSIVLLVGEPGSGRHVLARQAIAGLLGSPEFEAEPTVLTLNATDTVSSLPLSLLRSALPPDTLPDVCDAETAYGAVLAAQPKWSEDIIVLVDDADSADEATLQVVAALGGHDRYRILITARDLRQLPAAVGHLLRARDVTLVEVSPLSPEQSATLARHILDGAHLEAETASRLHRTSGGSPLFLVELIRSLTRSHSLSKYGDLVCWTADDAAPPSLPEFLLRELSRARPATRSALLTVALAEPVSLAALTQLGDIASPDALDTLFNLHIIREDAAPDGTPLVRTSNQLIGETARQAVTAGQRLQLLARIAETLPAGLEHEPAETLLRGIIVLLEVGAQPSPSALRRGLELARATNNHRLVVRIARALAAGTYGSEADRLRITAIMLTAVRHSGSEALLAEPDLLITPDPRDREPVAATGVSAAILPTPDDDAETALARIELGLARADILLYRDDDVPAARAVLAALQERSAHPSDPGHAAVISGAIIRLGYAGDFRAVSALTALPGAPQRVPELIPVAGVRILIEGQQGRLRSTRSLARRSLPVALRQAARYPSAGGEIFGALFMTEILNGQVRSAARLHRALLRAVEHPTAAYRDGTGYVAFATGTLAAAEGRWVAAAAEFAAAVDALSRADGAGFLPLALAGRALTLAATGMHERADAALARLESTLPRASRILEGSIRLNVLSAGQWLGTPSFRQEASDLVDWARERELALIELRALQVWSTSIQGAHNDHVSRAHELSATIGSEFAELLAAAVAERRPGGPTRDSPVVRELARRGVHSPFSWRAPLTPREREIAAFAVLGYPTKHIAGALAISTRTVEAHLAKLYAKLGVNDREGLAVHLDLRAALWAPDSVDRGAVMGIPETALLPSERHDDKT
ncbi:regulatory LuxR family protein [Mycolicibacterium mucogenicum 261Sha1.1M5]|nr:regulatory LuxR family protein [Mycolicibacterium mucogenicum 261Sha1.1M5]